MEVEVRLYLSNPLSLDEVTLLLSRFEGEIQTTVRTKDPKFELANSEQLDFHSIPSVAQFLASNGHLMERPILDTGSISCVGRPLDALQRLL
jgi:arsenate reductase-like glutaredoxin family protein